MVALLMNYLTRLSLIDTNSTITTSWYTTLIGISTLELFVEVIQDVQYLLHMLEA